MTDVEGTSEPRVVTGRTPTAGELMWKAAADELAPAKSLARIDERAREVVTSVSFVGTLLTGLGLVAGTRFDEGGWSRHLAVAGICLAVLAVVLALGVLLVRFPDNALPLNDLTAVRDFYRRQFHRIYLAIAAGVALLLALVLTGAAAVGVLAGGPDAATAGISVTVVGAGADTKLTVTAELPDVAAGATVSAQIVGVPPTGTKTVIGLQVLVTRTKGAVTVAFAAVPAGGYRTVEVLVEAPHWICTTTVTPDGGIPAAAVCRKR